MQETTERIECRCAECDWDGDVLAIAVCPQCGSRQIRRVEREARLAWTASVAKLTSTYRGALRLRLGGPAERHVEVSSCEHATVAECRVTIDRRAELERVRIEWEEPAPEDRPYGSCIVLIGPGINQ